MKKLNELTKEELMELVEYLVDGIGYLQASMNKQLYDLIRDSEFQNDKAMQTTARMMEFVIHAISSILISVLEDVKFNLKMTDQKTLLEELKSKLKSYEEKMKKFEQDLSKKTN